MFRKLIFVLLFWAGGGAAEPILIFAASSLKAPLDDLAADFERATGQTVVVSYAASSILARQISFGAPADVFISANELWMVFLQNQDLVNSKAVNTIAGNSLVIAAIDDEKALPLELNEILKRLDGGRLAVPLQQAVPLGQYAFQAFSKLGLQKGLAPHLAQYDSARATLVSLQRGEVPLAVLYASDIQQNAMLHAVAQIDPTLHDPVRYNAAPLTDGAKSREFISYLTSQDAKTIFIKFGYSSP